MTKDRNFFVYVPAQQEPAPGLSIRSVGHVLYHPPTACVRPAGWHTDVVVYTIRGRARGVFAGVHSVAKAGTMWIHRKEIPYHFSVDPEVGLWEAQWVECGGEWLRPLLTALGLGKTLAIDKCAAISATLVELLNCFRAHGDAGHQEAAALLWRALAAASRLQHAGGARDDAAGLVEKGKRFISDHLQGDIGLDEIARASGVSPFHFARLFKARTGSSPIAYLRAARMSKAQELLLGGADIKRIARDLRYSSAQHFTTAFTRWVGIPPGEYRNGIYRGR
jgi:AraC-like DNA-binding protein